MSINKGVMKCGSSCADKFVGRWLCVCEGYDIWDQRILILFSNVN